MAEQRDDRVPFEPIHGRPGFREHIDREHVPGRRACQPDEAYELLHTGLMLDGRETLNLASFVTTWMEPAGREADPRHAAQEPHRPRGVPGGVADRGGLRAHAGRPVQRAGPDAGRRRRRRSGPPRRSCSASSPTSGRGATAAQAAGLADRPAERRVRRRDPRGVGQVRQLLRRRDAQDPDEARTASCSSADDVEAHDRREHDRRRRGARHHPHRRGRPDRGDQRPAGADQGGEGLGHPAARRRRERRVHRPVRRARPALGLPARAGRVDQRVRATSTGWSTRASAG